MSSVHEPNALEEAAAARAAGPHLRPGTGGRRRRLPAGIETEATKRLREALGDPEDMGVGGIVQQVWRAERCDPDNGLLHRDGNGLLVCRLSTDDLHHGETIAGQYHQLREMVVRHNLRPRQILLTMRNSGAREYERRPDFDYIERSIAAGWCAWVAFRCTDRIGRAQLAQHRFYDLLRKTDTDLWLSRYGRKIDWDKDRLLLSIEGVFAEAEHQAIKERTHGALERRWLEEGRGWPSSKKFGFRRNKVTKYLEVDPEQWPWVKRIHLGYADLHSAMEPRGPRLERGGLRKLAEQLADEGCPMSVDKLRAILHDPVYVTGEWSVTREGEKVACRPVTLDDPIPLHIFERNQQLLQLARGKHTVTPIGTYLLNHVDFRHAACAELRHQLGPYRLKARTDYRETQHSRYSHSPGTPQAHCRGYTLPAAEVDAAVIRALRALADSPELQKAWYERARAKVADGSPYLTEGERRRLAQELEQIKEQIKVRRQEYMQRIRDGQEVTLEVYEDLMADLKREQRSLERRIKANEVLGAPPKHLTTTESEDLEAALEQVLVEATPEDPELRLRRAAFVETALSKVIARDTADGIELQLFGWLVEERELVTGQPNLRAKVHAVLTSRIKPTGDAAGDEESGGEGRSAGPSGESGEDEPEPADGDEGTGESSHTVRDCCESRTVWENHRQDLLRPELRFEDAALGGIGLARRAYGSWRARRARPGRPAFESPSIAVAVHPVLVGPVPDVIVLHSLAWFAARLPHEEPVTKPGFKRFSEEAALGGARCASTDQLYLLARRRGLHQDDLVRQALTAFGGTHDASALLDVRRHFGSLEQRGPKGSRVASDLRGLPLPAPGERLFDLHRYLPPASFEDARSYLAEHPYLDAALRARTRTFSLAECRDAIVDALDTLPAGGMFGPAGYQVRLEGTPGFPTTPTIFAACERHETTSTALLIEAENLREGFEPAAHPEIPPLNDGRALAHWLLEERGVTVQEVAQVAAVTKQAVRQWRKKNGTSPQGYAAAGLRRLVREACGRSELTR